MSNEIDMFENGDLRRIWVEETEEWYFAIVDVIAILTDSSNPRRYWSDLKRKLRNEGAEQLYEKIVQLKLKASDGRMRETDVANVETLLRIIQSVPSPKAEPLKQWLAQVGNERLEEIEDPAIALERIRAEYRQRGYNEDWIDKRIQSIVTRNELTDEWEARGVKVGKEYAILTSIISSETFGLSPSQHKKLKKLKRENLRDHMTSAELVFTMLGEVSTTEMLATTTLKDLMRIR